MKGSSKTVNKNASIRILICGTEMPPGNMPLHRALDSALVDEGFRHREKVDLISVLDGTQTRTLSFGIEFASSRMDPQKRRVSKKKLSATTSFGAAMSIGR